MLLLTTNQLVRYLVRQQARRGTVALLRLRAQNISSDHSRNQCFMAWWSEQEAWFVKQPYTTGQYLADGIFNEARFYDFIKNRLPDWLIDKKILSRSIPHLIDFDPNHRMLVLERLNDFRPVPCNLYKPGGLDLRESDFPEKAATILRLFHKYLTRDKVLCYQKASPFKDIRPLLLVSQEALLQQLLTDNPLANGTFLNTLRTGLIQNTERLSLVINLSKNWDSGCLIHGDTAWRNWMYKPMVDQAQRVELRLVDWEQACLGDLRWDQAVFLADYIRAKRANNSVSPVRILDHLNRFHRAYYANDANRPSFGNWAESVLQLAAISLLQRLLERFIELLNSHADNRRDQEIKIARDCREWLRLLTDPFKCLEFTPVYTDESYTDFGTTLAELD